MARSTADSLLDQLAAAEAIRKDEASLRLEGLFTNIGALLPRHARYRPDHLALVVGDQRLTYRALNAIVNRLANALLANGVTKGDKIATLLPNCLELMTAYWAAAKTGIVIVPMSTLLQERGLASLLRDSDSIVLLADASFAETLDQVVVDGECTG